MERSQRLAGDLAVARRATGGEAPSSDEEALAFLRTRVAAFGRAGALIGATSLLARVVVHTVFDANQAILDDPTFGWHVAAAMIFALIEPAIRLGPRSVRYVVTVEGLGLVLGSLAYIAMGLFLPMQGAPVETLALILTFGTVARAIFVPSTPRRTLLLHLHIAVPFAVLMFFVSQQAAREHAEVITQIQELRQGFQIESPTELGFLAAFGSVFWFSFTTALCVAASKVIFGLRREVADVRRLGRYTLDEKLGEGGMGVVYRASHAMLRRPTAVKILHAGAGADERRLARFEREVQRTAALSHPNTITVFDYGRTPEGLFYYAMELLDGATLEEVVEADGPMPTERTLHVLGQVVGAMVEAHESGLIHRDLKPANIMLARLGGEADVAKVLDFGLVKELDRSSPELSTTEQLTGTPDYLAPEAIASPDAVDARADLYALGAVAYFLVTGRRVFDGRSVVEVCSQHLHVTPTPPSSHGAAVEPALEAIVLRCLEKRPEHRFPDARALLAALRAVPAAPWKPDDAEAWWATHGPEVSVRRSLPRTPAAPTMDVALAHRD
ncbi:MAG: serine/threonine-protein kinase [Myxococcota bacterium]